MSQLDTNKETNGAHNGHAHELPPCSCCMALAHVRIPAAGYPFNGAQASGAQTPGGPSPAAQPSAAQPAAAQQAGAQPSNGTNMADNAGGTQPADAKAARKAVPLFALPSVNLFGNKRTKPAAEDQDGEDDPGTAECRSKKPPEPEWDEELLGPKPRKLWQGLDGIAVVLFGVVIPALLSMLSFVAVPKRLTLVILNHPMETLAEIGLLAAIPLVNWLVWRAMCKHKLLHIKIAGLALGLTTGSGLVIAGMFIAALFAPYQQSLDGSSLPAGLSWLAMLSIAAAGVSGYLTYRIRATLPSAKLRTQVVAVSAIGLTLAAGAFAASEARPWTVRYAERLAVSPKPAEFTLGLKMLRDLKCERELHMECADTRAAGYAGMFTPIKLANLHELYFRMTGVPYSYHETKVVDLSSMPDDYLSRNIVGDPVAGLQLRRSTLNAVLHPRTMSGTVHWTFVFKNDTDSAQEARAEFALPPGAVVNGLTSWDQGDTIPGAVALTERTEATAATGIGDKRANLSDIGHGRVLLHCYNLPTDREFQIRVSMAIPLKPETNDMTTAVLPRFIATNFSLEGEQQISVRSAGALTSELPGLALSRTTAGENVLAGDISAEDIQSSKLQIKCKRADAITKIATADPIATTMALNEQRRRDREAVARQQAEDAAEQENRNQVVLMLDGSRGIQTQIDAVSHALKKKKVVIKSKQTVVAPRYVVETVERLSVAPPKYLVVVVDGSNAAKPYAANIKEALAKLPANVKTDVIIASQEHPELAKPTALPAALHNWNNDVFAGGQDNLKAVVQAAELAGQNVGGAVLWVHGAQPSLNQEIYIMSPYAAAPSFYELSLGTEDLDTTSLFRNHPGIGPFEPVAHRSAKLADDLGAFFDQWKKDTSTYAVKLELTNTNPAVTTELNRDEKRELLTLHAAEKCASLLRDKHRNKAALLAASYGFVCPVSYAFIPESIAETNADEKQTHVLDAFANAGPSAPVAAVNAAASAAFVSMNAVDEAINNEVAMMQGATNGTIGPQGMDATVISGVNTAGTVRINNLANLEAMLNIIANLGEILLLLLGGLFVLHGATQKEDLVEVGGREFEMPRAQRIFIGIMIALCGTAIPGVINWFVASARDANLFS